GLLRGAVIGVGVAARVVIVHPIAGIPHVADATLGEGLRPAWRAGMRSRYNASAGVGRLGVIWVELSRSGARARGTGEAARWEVTLIRGIAIHRERLASLGLLVAGTGRQRIWLHGLGIDGVLARGWGSGWRRLAAVGRLCRVIDGRGRVWFGVGLRRVGQRKGQLRRGLGSRRVEWGNRSSGETSSWGSEIVGGSRDRGSVGWAHILRLFLGPRTTRLPLSRRVLRLLDIGVATSRGLEVGWGWLG
ncbi:MAG: hypothetical protein FD142_3193, partial [bacterium]